MVSFILFVVLTFVIVVSLVLLAEDLVTAMLIISVLANFLVICSQYGSLSDKLSIRGHRVAHGSGDLQSVAPHGETTTAAPESVSVESADSADSAESMWSHGQPDDLDTDEGVYGADYAAWQRRKLDYAVVSGEYSEPAVTSNTVDSRVAQMARRRALDERALVGAATKDVNYYSYHLGDELSVNECKPWWGLDEY